MENSIENFHLFAGNYPMSAVRIGAGNRYSHLQLRPLSSITDDEIVELLQFLDIDSGEYKTYSDDDNSCIMVEMSAFSFHINFDSAEISNLKTPGFISHSNLVLGIYDWLRHKNFAIQWMDMGVQEMVDNGWIKLDKE